MGYAAPRDPDCRDNVARQRETTAGRGAGSRHWQVGGAISCQRINGGGKVGERPRATARFLSNGQGQGWPGPGEGCTSWRRQIRILSVIVQRAWSWAFTFREWSTNRGHTR